MKKVILTFGILVLLSWKQTKTYTVTLPIEDWVKISNGLDQASRYLKMSDLPSRDVVILTDSIIGPLWREINTQVGKQQRDTTKIKK